MRSGRQTAWRCAQPQGAAKARLTRLKNPMKTTASNPVPDPFCHALQSPDARARLHLAQDLQPGFGGIKVRDSILDLTCDSPVCQEACRPINAASVRVTTYYPFFFTAARIELETRPAAFNHWLALGFLAGFHLEQHADLSPVALPEPDPQGAARWLPSVFAYLEQADHFYPRLLALMDAWIDAVSRDRPGLCPQHAGLRELLIGMDTIDLGRRFARETGEAQREKLRFAIEHFRSFQLQPHPSQWQGRAWPLCYSLELWQQQVARSLVIAFQGPGALTLHPLIQACRTRYSHGTGEQGYFAVYYDLATQHGGLGLPSGPVAWLDDAAAYANTIIAEAPEIATQVLHTLTGAELESEWRTACHDFEPHLEATRERLLRGVATRLQRNHGLLLRPTAPFLTIDQIVHGVDALVWKCFLDAYWERRI